MLYGVKKIEFCAANLLAFNGKENVYYGVAPELLTPLTEIQCVPMARASLSIEQTVQNKEVLYTSKLQFVTDADPELAVGYYAFVVTTVAGERILIGAQLRPRVVVTTTQSVAGTAGELTAFTTSAEWTTDYKPLRLPVASAVITDGRTFDICCGQIAQPQEPDTRVFDICCGEIRGEEPPTLLTVRWLDGDGSVLDSKTYYSNQPEPTTTEVPTKASTSHYDYTFNHWEVLSNVGGVKTYQPIFTSIPTQIDIYYTYSGEGTTVRHVTNRRDSHTETTASDSNITNPPFLIMYFNGRFSGQWYFKFVDTEGCTILTADWSEFNACFPELHPIFHPNNPTLQIGYYSDEWQGEI